MKKNELEKDKFDPNNFTILNKRKTAAQKFQKETLLSISSTESG